MNYLIEKSQRLTSKLDVLHPRYLFNQIDWTQRLIAIKGARGTGKTILLLQYLKSLNLPGNMAIYISLDDFYFTSNSLMDFAHHFYLKGGKILAIDEVHKYPNWSRELKNVYDSYPDLKLVFTSSSILELYKGIGDLSRRLTSYQLYGLSYRNFAHEWKYFFRTNISGRCTI
ncbi:MAG: AAA family ATPase [Saprospiraceae bacterium]|nr:AAA family ATPase [Saprospiraceae bacterium]